MDYGKLESFITRLEDECVANNLTRAVLNTQDYCNHSKSLGSVNLVAVLRNEKFSSLIIYMHKFTAWVRKNIRLHVA